MVPDDELIPLGRLELSRKPTGQRTADLVGFRLFRISGCGGSVGASEAGGRAEAQRASFAHAASRLDQRAAETSMTYRREQHGVWNGQAMAFGVAGSALPCLPRDGP